MFSYQNGTFSSDTLDMIENSNSVCLIVVTKGKIKIVNTKRSQFIMC